MEDLSGMLVPRMPVTEGFLLGLPQAIMDSFSDKSVTDEAARMIGFSNAPEEVAPDEESESSD